MHSICNDRCFDVAIIVSAPTMTTEKSFELTTTEGTEVRGLAYMDGRIYILQALSKLDNASTIIYSAIGVYRMEDECWQPEVITNEEYNRPQDMVACSSLSVLYILDQLRIWEVRKDVQKSVYERSSKVSATMSITRTHLLVVSSEDIRKYEYGSDFKAPMSELRLPVGLSETKPWHAVEVDDGHVISHAEAENLHRVSKFKEIQRDMSKSKVEVFTYGKNVGKGEDQLSSPVYLVVEPEYGAIFVADHDNSRVVVLDRNLKKVMTINDLPEGCYPSRLCYVEERSLLLVGMSNGLVVGYKVKRYVIIHFQRY